MSRDRRRLFTPPPVEGDPAVVEADPGHSRLLVVARPCLARHSVQHGLAVRAGDGTPLTAIGCDRGDSVGASEVRWPPVVRSG